MLWASDNPERREPPIVGRWDIVVESSEGQYPSWLEVRLSGNHTLVGSFVGHFGSARPISRVIFKDGEIHFSVPPQWEHRADDLQFSGRLDGAKLHGETTDDKGQPATWTARRAPSLHRAQTPRWGEPIALFNGRDLSGWQPRSGQTKNGWTVRDGLLVNAEPGNDLLTERKFTDFKLHAEFRYPKGSNSGIYLRGRYEMQIEDNYGDEPDSHKIGGIYGFLMPRINAGRKPGKWQAADITLLGRVVTVVLNGECVIDARTEPAASPPPTSATAAYEETEAIERPEPAPPAIPEAECEDVGLEIEAPPVEAPSEPEHTEAERHDRKRGRGRRSRSRGEAQASEERSPQRSAHGRRGGSAQGNRRGGRKNERSRREPAPDASPEPVEERAPTAPEAEDTDSDDLRDLSTWKVPSWDELIASLYRPER
jgi:hypothetical protein